jgi:hypothetical protein
MSLTKFIFASDVHGDQQEPAANEVLFDFIDIWKPKLRVFGGDLWDFRALRKAANEDERRESMEADYKAGLKWIKRFKPHVFLRGNHDERLWELAASNKGVQSDYAMKGVVEILTLMDKMKCKMLPYHHRDGIYRLGSLKMLHGFHCGMNAARQTALVYGSSLIGHVHTIDEHSIPGLERRVARSVGCLCKLSMDYQIRIPSHLRHSHGFAFGVVNEKTGNFFVWQAESVDGKWILPSDIIEL